MVGGLGRMGGGAAIDRTAASSLSFPCSCYLSHLVEQGDPTISDNTWECPRRPGFGTSIFVHKYHHARRRGDGSTAFLFSIQSLELILKKECSKLTRLIRPKNSAPVPISSQRGCLSPVNETSQ